MILSDLSLYCLTPSCSHLSWSMCVSASYMQKGLSMVVHSVMNPMEPRGSAEISHIASSLEGEGEREGGRERGKMMIVVVYLCCAWEM